MNCIFKSFSIVVLNIFFIFAVNSASTEKKSAESYEQGSVEQLQGPNGDSGELQNGSDEESSVSGSQQLQGPNDEIEDDLVEKLQGPNRGSTEEEEGSVQQLQGPNDESGIIAKEFLQAKHNTETAEYVELNTYENETIIAKLIKEKNAENDKELDKSDFNKPQLKDNSKLKDNMVITSYLDIDKISHEVLDADDIGSDSEATSGENKNPNAMDHKQEEIQFLEELKRGNKAESYGSNPHYYQPDKYPELNRRFVSHYPYNENEGINIVKGDAKGQMNLEPKLASPDLVLAVAKESAMLDAARPNIPSEYLIEKKTLRSGNYWNAIWKEDVNPTVLRSNSKKPLGVIPAKINPGSNLYDLVSKLKQVSPRLLYVINKKIKQ